MNQQNMPTKKEILSGEQLKVVNGIKDLMRIFFENESESIMDFPEKEIAMFLGIIPTPNDVNRRLMARINTFFVKLVSKLKKFQDGDTTIPDYEKIKKALAEKQVDRKMLAGIINYLRPKVSSSYYVT